MSDEKDKNRIDIEDLSQPKQTLTSEEAKQVKGGVDLSSGGGGEAEGRIKFNEFQIKKTSDKVLP